MVYGLGLYDLTDSLLEVTLDVQHLIQGQVSLHIMY